MTDSVPCHFYPEECDVDDVIHLDPVESNVNDFVCTSHLIELLDQLDLR